MSSNCKHEGYHYRGVVTRNYLQAIFRESAVDRCNDCGEYLSLGPANDTPEVLIEIRAAEIAAYAADRRSRLSSQFLFQSYAEHAAWRGEEAIRDLVVMRGGKRTIDHDVPLNLESPSYLAGYLARCIDECIDESTLSGADGEREELESRARVGAEE